MGHLYRLLRPGTLRLAAGAQVRRTDEGLSNSRAGEAFPDPALQRRVQVNVFFKLLCRWLARGSLSFLSSGFVSASKQDLAEHNQEVRHDQRHDTQHLNDLGRAR
jgi:hypothetical protein